MARKPLMLMRKKNLLGTIMGKYANLQNTVAKGVGHYYDVSGGGYRLKMNSGFVSEDGLLVTVIFSQNVFFTEGTLPNGMAITNTTTADTATITSASGSGTGQVEYVVTWASAIPAFGDVLQIEYEGETLISVDLVINNGDFNGASITGWEPQNVTVYYELFDGKSTVRLESSGNYTMLKQAVPVTAGQTYEFTVEVHTDNNVHTSGIAVYDGDLEGVEITNAHNPARLVQLLPDPSPSWQVLNVQFTPTGNQATICLEQAGVSLARFHEVVAV